MLEGMGKPWRIARGSASWPWPWGALHLFESTLKLVSVFGYVLELIKLSQFDFVYLLLVVTYDIQYDDANSSRRAA